MPTIQHHEGKYGSALVPASFANRGACVMLTALLIIAFFILCAMYARRARNVRRRQAHKTLRTYNEMTRWTEAEQRNLSAHLSENDPLYEVARLEFRSNERALHEQELERMKLARVLGIPLEEARRI